MVAGNKMSSGITLCSVLAVAVVLGGASGCLSGWGAFTESLLTDVCPALTSKISGLVKGHSIGKCNSLVGSIDFQLLSTVDYRRGSILKE